MYDTERTDMPRTIKLKGVAPSCDSISRVFYIIVVHSPSLEEIEPVKCESLRKVSTATHDTASLATAGNIKSTTNTKYLRYCLRDRFGVCGDSMLYLLRMIDIVLDRVLQDTYWTQLRMAEGRGEPREVS